MRTKMRGIFATTPRAGADAVLERLRRGIAKAGIDCSCHHAANDMLDRAGVEEDLMRRAEGLADTRKIRDAMMLALALLGELDELRPDEPDRSAFREIAGLFEDVADFAAYGASAATGAAGPCGA